VTICVFFIVTIDTRTRGWWMVNSVFTTLTITLCYLLIVWLTPRYMKNHTAYNLKNVLIIYNIIMIITNLFVIIEVMKILLHVELVSKNLYQYISR